MTTAERYTIETTTSKSRGMALADAGRRLQEHRMAGRFAMVSRDSDGTTIMGVHGFYFPPYHVAPTLTAEEREALGVR